MKVQVSDDDQNELCQEIKPIQERILESIVSFKHLDPSIPVIGKVLVSREGDLYYTLDDEIQEQDYLTISKGGTADITSEVWTELNSELEELKGLSVTLLEQVQVG